MATIPEALALAVQHHQGGRLQAAEQIYRKILAVEPNHADAMHLLGVIASQSGKHAWAAEYIEGAIRLQGNEPFYHNNLGEVYRTLGKYSQAADCFRRALELQPDSAETHNNLGIVRRAEGKVEEAIACYGQALALKPDFSSAHNNLGIAFSDRGKTEDAVACYRRSLELAPDFGGAHNNLGNALRKLGRLEEAIVCFRRALELTPGLAEAHNNLGVAWHDLGKLDEAAACYRRSLELAPNSADAFTNLGNVLKDQGKVDEAVACYRQATVLKPDSADAHYKLGAALTDQGKIDEAVVCYRRTVELRPQFAEALCNLGCALREQGNLDEAAACLGRALELEPNVAEAHNNFGNVLRDQGKLEQGIASYLRALELKPDFAVSHNNLGTALELMGDLGSAEDSFRAALLHDPEYAFANYKLAELLGGRLPEEDLARQRRLLDGAKLTDEQRIMLHFGLARVMDGRANYAEAAEHLDRANALQLVHWRKRGQEYDPNHYTALVTRMIGVCGPDFFARVHGFGLDSEIPVFVVGLPRSGTTLVEQILASHSRIFGAGEIKLARETAAALGPEGADYIDGLCDMDRAVAGRLAAWHLQRLQAFDPAAARIVDKMPENYLFLGLLTSLFPRAKFIHCRRDLRDVAVSCWMTHFREVRWACDPRHIASRFRDYRRMMEHWRAVLSAPLLEVDYEETVSDLETVSRRLVAWCGLEWEPGCLDFHRAPRLVATASAVQVRRPIFTTSVGRWKHFEQALAGLFAELPQG